MLCMLLPFKGEYSIQNTTGLTIKDKFQKKKKNFQGSIEIFHHCNFKT